MVRTRAFKRWRGPVSIGLGVIGLGFVRPRPADAQADSSLVVSGQVTRSQGEPIPGCEVLLMGTSRQAACDDNGRFVLRGLSVGGGVIQIRKIGFRPQFLRVSSADAMVPMRAVLEPGIARLPDLVVEARHAKPARYAWTTKYDDFFRRQRIRGGTFLTQEMIDARPRMRTIELLQGIPGIRTSVRPPGSPEGSVVDIARCSGFPPRINVYVNGVKLIRDSRFKVEERSFSPSNQSSSDPEAYADMRAARGAIGEMLDRINPSEVELMEVYRGVSDLPGEFHDDNCAAIVIWTK